MSQSPKAAGRPQAILHTSAGDITCELYTDKAPKTAENFIGLATGSKEWTHPGTREKMVGKPLYSGTVFHRTIPGFMIQGGDPLGSGTGGPGYKFDNEDSDLKFDRAGVMAMANAGRNTNGCQFFITVGAQPHLNGGYTIFGQVISGQDVVDKISKMPTDMAQGGKAKSPVKIERIEIVPAGG